MVRCELAYGGYKVAALIKKVIKTHGPFTPSSLPSFSTLTVGSSSFGFEACPICGRHLRLQVGQLPLHVDFKRRLLLLELMRRFDTVWW
jgi:hypothetical protein